MRSILIILLLFVPGHLSGQSLLPNQSGDRPLLMQGDWALLEAAEARNDLGCALHWNKPKLGFDLRYHSEFEAHIPLENVKSSDLLVLLRVTPDQGSPSYFKQLWKASPDVPAGADISKAIYRVRGSFDAGPGKYKAEWLLRDALGNACFQTENISVPVAEGLQIKANQLLETLDQDFKPEMCLYNSTEATSSTPVHLFVNYAPSLPGFATPPDHDREAILSMIRLFSRDCSISQLYLTVFDLERQQVLFKNDTSRVNFAELGNALSNAQHGTIDIATLKDSPNAVTFLQELVGTSSGSKLFIGPAATGVNAKVPEGETFSSCDQCAYLHYEPQPVTNPDWIDAMGRWIRRVRGTKFDIRQPRDLLQAFPQVSRIIRGTPPVSQPPKY
jgi:hypothetical protein